MIFVSFIISFWLSFLDNWLVFIGPKSSPCNYTTAGKGVIIAKHHKQDVL